MKALVFEKYGKASAVLELRDIPVPKIGAGQVKVKMLLSPVNPSDIYNTIEGTYKDAMGRVIWNFGKQESEYALDPLGERLIPSLPHVPGLEGVGIVVAAGKGLRGKWLMGKRVAVVGAKTGNWQEFNVVDARQALPVASYLSDEEAATFFVNPATAYIMIRSILRCKRGEYLLQSAANSELGKMIIRLGRSYGFRSINLVRDSDQEMHLREIGADHVINIKENDIRAQVHKITNGQGVAYALDPVGGELASSMIRCLGSRGRMLVYGTLTSDPLVFSPRDLMTPMAAISGFFLANYLADKSILQKLSLIRSIGKLIKRGELRSETGPVYSIDDYQAALDAVNSPGNRGKVLLRLNG